MKFCGSVHFFFFTNPSVGQSHLSMYRYTDVSQLWEFFVEHVSPFYLNQPQEEGRSCLLWHSWSIFFWNRQIFEYASRFQNISRMSWDSNISRMILPRDSNISRTTLPRDLNISKMPRDLNISKMPQGSNISTMTLPRGFTCFWTKLERCLRPRQSPE